MKIIFFGTSEFAIPALQKLHESDFEIVAVITQPDKPAGRKQKPLPSPVKTWALERGLKVQQPLSLEIRNLKTEISDVGVVASYGKIIPKSLLSWPKHGILNLHPSLLPKYRGPSPIHAAILNGDAETGISIIKLDEEMDHGDIVATITYNLKSKTYYKELHDELAKLGAELIVKILPDYVSGKIKPAPQDHSKATFTKIITKDDARIDWSKSVQEIERQIRAYHIWPVAWTTLSGKRLKIYKATSFPPPQPLGGEGGEVAGMVIAEDNKASVHTGSGILQIFELQLEGGKILPASEFIKGHRNLKGAILQ